MMSASLHAWWVSLAVSPLFWLTATLLAFVLGKRFQTVCGGSPLANPVLFAIALLIAMLKATGTSYTTYFAGAQFIHFLLGPATVALAVPLALNMPQIRQCLRPTAVALLAGSIVSAASGVLIVWLLGGGRELAMSMAPKAATTPIAMAVAFEVGGIPPLTAALAIGGGIVAACVGQTLLRTLQVNDWRAQGLAAGVAGSGIAAAQIAPLSSVAAAFAAIGIGVNGLVTSLIVPLLAQLWH